MYLCYVFIIVVRKLNVDLSLQEPEGLKGVYGSKSFYLPKDEKHFFTQWYANGKDVIVCGYENSHIDNGHCASCFGKYSNDGDEGWIQRPVFMPAVV